MNKELLIQIGRDKWMTLEFRKGLMSAWGTRFKI